MNRSRILSYILILVCVCSIAAFTIAGPPTFEINWSTIDGGGGSSFGGGFALSGTIGQPDAGPTMTGGPFEVAGGFWPGVTSACFADLDFSGEVNVNDLLLLIGAWGPNELPADLNNTGEVNVDDLLLLIGAWGPCP